MDTVQRLTLICGPFKDTCERLGFSPRVYTDGSVWLDKDLNTWGFPTMELACDFLCKVPGYDTAVLLG